MYSEDVVEFQRKKLSLPSKYQIIIIRTEPNVQNNVSSDQDVLLSCIIGKNSSNIQGKSGKGWLEMFNMTVYPPHL